ncbi:MAG: DUF1015 domain-containing protein [Planctomycetota bacterium]
MPEIRPFAALRYNADHIASLSEVVAPPYDVIDPELQETLYKRHPANTIRIILNRAEPGDSGDERYERAASFVRQWQQQGVLKRDETPGFYVYHQLFDVAGQAVCRRGFMARVRIEPFGEGAIYPHEETHPKAKVDRLKLTRATKQNNSQIFGLYPDPKNEVIDALDAATRGAAPSEATDDLGVLHRLWSVKHPDVCRQVESWMQDRPMFVADGHHRYETATNYRNERMEEQASLPDDAPERFVMTMLVGMSDPGMIVLPTHRLLRRTKRFRASDLVSALENCFACEVLLGGVAAADDAWQQMNSAKRQDWLALYAAEDDAWVLAKARPSAATKMQELAPEQSDDWRSLGVSLLHRLVIDHLLDSESHPKPTYVHDVDEVVAGLRGEGSQAESDGDEPYSLAALVMPATLEHIEAISMHRERMPAKSTYFYPKLLSGLTFNPLTP